MEPSITLSFSYFNSQTVIIHGRGRKWIYRAESALLKTHRSSVFCLVFCLIFVLFLSCFVLVVSCSVIFVFFHLGLRSIFLFLFYFYFYLFSSRFDSSSYSGFLVVGHFLSYLSVSFLSCSCYRLFYCVFCLSCLECPLRPCFFFLFFAYLFCLSCLSLMLSVLSVFFVLFILASTCVPCQLRCNVFIGI